jgi:very-short-patch-repair endonuclease
MSPDAIVARIATRQQAMVSTRQLHAAGLTESAIRARVRAGRLHRMHDQVYAVGHLALPPLASEYAAWLAAGEDAVISDRSGAAMWALFAKDPDVVDVTVPTRRRSRKGIRVHHRQIPPEDIRIREGLPVTSPLRTIADLAGRGGLGTADLERVVAEALFRRYVTEEQLRTVPKVRKLLDDGRAASRHEAERILARLIHKAGLPRPLRNERRHGHELDVFWPEHRVNLELDGFASHGHRLGFERDRRRDLQLKAHGIDVIRITWRQLTREPERVIALLARVTSHERTSGR